MSTSVSPVAPPCELQNALRALALLALLFAPAARAHHSDVVAFDLAAEVVHENVMVIEWRFINPHALLVFEAPRPGGGRLVRWTAQSSNTSRLRRFGFGPTSFAAGDVLTIRGHPSRDGLPELNLTGAVRNDGTAFDFGAVRALAALPSAVEPAQIDTEPGDAGLTGVWENILAPVPPEVVRTLVPQGAFFWPAFGQAPEPERGDAAGLPLTDQAHALMARWGPGDDECRPPSGWRALGSPYLQEIEAPRSGRLQIKGGFLDVERTIWLDGRSHPPLEQEPRSLQGHSVGRWHGTTLVVETSGMLANAVTRNGVYHSDNAVLEERFTRSGDTLTVLRVLVDPEHFAQPVASVLRLARRPDPEVPPYGECIRRQHAER